MQNQVRLFALLFYLVWNSVLHINSSYASISSGLALPNEIRNWGLDNTIHSHINVKRAWNFSRGSRAVIVAIIDTGIDPKHPALKHNLWKKPNSKNLEYGWDYVTNTANPVDIHGHGTHIAGIIGAVSDPQTGIVGVAPLVSIMALRFYSDHSTDEQMISNTVNALDYAIRNGAHIINYSAGGSTFTEEERKAFARVKDKGILVIASAGNKSKNTDKENNKFYPASYGFENIISVAGSDQENHLVTSSNWGPHTVHITAPGENILSTLPGGTYGYLTGTSQSAAFVTGVAVLLLAKYPELKGNPKAVKSLILDNADKLAQLESKVVSGGRLNAFATLAAITNQSSKKISIKMNRMPSTNH